MTTQITTKTIDPDHAEELFCDDDGTTAGPWTRVTEVAYEARRWMQYHELILRHEDGTYWSLGYDRGLTEEQPHELPWRENRKPVELTQVYPHEVTTTVYRTKPAGASA